MPSDEHAYLTDQASWPAWIIHIRQEARNERIWELVDPDGRQAEPEYPKPQRIDEFRASFLKDALERYERDVAAWRARPESERGQEPPKPRDMTTEDFHREYANYCREYDMLRTDYESCRKKLSKLRTRIRETVSPDLYKIAERNADINNDSSVRRLIVELKEQVAPGPASSNYAAENAYLEVLAKAKQRSVVPATWIKEWNVAYNTAKAHNLQVATGPGAVERFLEAVSVYIAPGWGTQELQAVIAQRATDEEIYTLEDYGKQLAALLQAESTRKTFKQPSIFTTSTPNFAGTPKEDGGSKSSKRTLHACPCRGGAGKHFWKPEDCRMVKAAVTGDYSIAKVTPAQVKKIKERLKEPQWKDLRKHFEGSGKPSVRFKDSQDALIATVIDPKLIGTLGSFTGGFSTLAYARHPLSDSTVFDNCGAIHVVNSRDLLEPGTYVATKDGEHVAAGSATFPISGKGRRVLPKALDGPKGRNTVDLVLEDVAVVEGFHVNIISEALLNRAGVWYCGLDCSLRKGDLNKSVKVKQLQRALNLVFFEYNPRSLCFEFPRCVPVSPAGIVELGKEMTKLPLLLASSRRSARPLPPREGTSEVWHLRAGHLGADAMEHLEANGRMVKIKGIPRIKCEKCSTTHASQVVSRRTSEGSSQRPFWRILWDLFEFPTGYNGASYLLVIKDEYSGKIWVYPLRTKDGATLLEHLRNFESWVWRQYGLRICKIRQDRDTGTLGPDADDLYTNTAFTRWTTEAGIDVEPTPSYTHEPNGGAERAGQEVITRSIKMREGAGLPEELWPEVVQAAAYLHGMSPRKRNEWKSPNEVLNNWFKQWFRWWSPNITHALTADLRPNWSGVYAYGCKAYPLQKLRERGEHRRDYKVRERGHVGYLVGYRASNLYRVWVPELDRVITTRNVRFDEDSFYKPPQEQTPQQIAQLRRLANDLDQEEEAEPTSILRRLLEPDDDGPILDSITVALPPAEEPEDDESEDESEDDEEGSEESEEDSEEPDDDPQEARDSGVGIQRGGSSDPYQPPAEALETRLPTPPESEQSDLAERESSSQSSEGSSEEEGSEEDSGDDSDEEGGDDNDSPPAPSVALPRTTGNIASSPEAGQRGQQAQQRPQEQQGQQRQQGQQAQQAPRRPEPSQRQQGQQQAQQGPKQPEPSGENTKGQQAVKSAKEHASAPPPTQRPRPVVQQARPGPSQGQPPAATKSSTEPEKPSGKRPEKVFREGERRSPRIAATKDSTEKDPPGKDQPPKGGGTGGAAKSAMAPEMALTTMVTRSKERFSRALKALYETFLPDQQECDTTEISAFTTLYAVLAAAFNQKHARLGASPNLPIIHRDQLVKPPRTWKELDKHELGERFREAAYKEVRNMMRRKTWRLIASPVPWKKPLPLKWVFTYKFDKNGWLQTCKARLVVRGDLQPLSAADSTYAATLAARSFRLMMAIMAYFDLECKQFDVAQAFLNASREGREPVVCELPEGFKKPGYAVELQKALYGLRDSPLLWYKEFSATLAELGLKPSAEEPCLFIAPESKVVVVFYVDDILVFYHRDYEEAANRVIQGFKAKYEVHDQGDVEWFLGIRVIRDRPARKVWLVHDQYIEKVAKRYGLTGDKSFPPTPLPGVELVKYTGEASKQEVKQYQELVGSILYTAIMVRPDVAYAAAKLSQFLTNPAPEHLKAAKHTIRYLYGTRFLSIAYGAEHQGAQHLVIASDASFADDVETRRSSQGYLFMLFGGLINWRASRQETVTTSSTEAELLALAQTGKETLALQRMLRDLRLELGEVWKIFCDNTQTIRLVVGESERIHTRLRHVDIHNLWLRQEYGRGAFEVAYLPTADMPADGLTKNLPRHKFEQFRALLNLQDTRHILTKGGAGNQA